ncbi:hypothetical protein [Mycolicibacterium sp.]
MTGTALLAELIALNPRELADVNAGVRAAGLQLRTDPHRFWRGARIAHL